MKKILLSLCASLVFLNTYGQYRNLSLKDYKTWSVQGNLSGNWAHTDIVPNSPLYSSVNYSLGYGLRINKFITHNFGLALDGYRTQFKGENNFKSYNTDVNYQFSVLAMMQTGNISYIDAFKNFQLYGYLGYGTINYTSNFINKNNSNKNNSVKENQQIIPIGLGLKYHLKENVTLNMEYCMNKVNGDNLDAFSDALTEYDDYSKIQFGISYTFGHKDDIELEWHDPRPRFVAPATRKDTVVIIQQIPVIDSSLLSNNKNNFINDSALYDSLILKNTNLTIFYEFNKFNILGLYNSKLENIALECMSRMGSKIMIESYTDTIGSPENNVIIVQRRSVELSKFFNSIGVPSEKIEIKLHDETDAIMPTDAENRKSKVYLIK